jgi:protein-S-isoprenylcysteine O-methyltransferase Ste14
MENQPWPEQTGKSGIGYDIQMGPPLDEVQGALTGVVGVIVLLAGAVAFAFLGTSHPLAHLPGGPDLRYAQLLLVALLSMLLCEAFYYKVYRRNFDFGKPQKLTPEKKEAVWNKFSALLISFILATFCYWVIGEYALPARLVSGTAGMVRSWYRPFFSCYFASLPVLLAFSIPYLFLAEKYGTWAAHDDEMLCAFAGYMALARLSKPDPAFYNVMRAFAVKFFFVPLMVTYFAATSVRFEGDIQQLLALLAKGLSASGEAAVYRSLYACLFDGVFYFDLALCVVGYTFTNRLFDTHVRSAEPTCIGWLAAVACYKPFSTLMDTCLTYNACGRTWNTVFWNHPRLYLVVTMGIIALLAVYLWATVMFGLRFSNLTNRGILCKGPYAVVRHPAYISKNLAWWLIALPCMGSFRNVGRLLIWNSIYYLRAITEERHLLRDPYYVEYAGRVRARFIPFV